MHRIISNRASKFRRHLGRSTSATVAAAAVPPDSQSHIHILWRRQILAPDSEIVAHWNHFFLLNCLGALFVDPLYFYLPSVAGPACLASDLPLSLVVTLFRTVADLFFALHIIVKFRTAFVAPSSKIFGRGEFVMDPRQIALRYLKSDFLIDLAAALPLPQIVIWLIIPATRNSRADHANNTLALFVLIQYIPRLFIMFPLNNRIVKTTGVVAKTAWAGAAYNLLLYMLASHVIGASWYLLSIGRQFSCWQIECARENVLHPNSCLPSFLDCNSLKQPNRVAWLNTSNITNVCNARNADLIGFNYGMFADAFTNDVVSSGFVDKYLYCLWWGLRNLSSYGQNVETSRFLGETLFCILLCIIGLILFSHLIGNMQTYLQSMTVRLEEWRVKRRDTEEWMRHRQLPPDLQERVRRFVQYQWLATRGVNEESILRSLPLDLRREIQRHLCLALVRRVPFFSQMDDQLLDAICERLVSSLSIPGTYILQEDDPVSEMLFIIRGTLESSTTDGGRSGFFNSITLRPGDFCGEELLTWALVPSSSLNLPSSTRTVVALTEVEAFALRQARSHLGPTGGFSPRRTQEDLKFVSGQFKRLHSKKLQHAFRYHSQQWRTWGTCFIQAAWRRFKKRKMAKELAAQEELYNAQFGGEELNERAAAVGNSLGVTILASRFAKNTRRGISNQKAQSSLGGAGVGDSSSSLKMPKLFKPNEPDFSLDHEDV